MEGLPPDVEVSSEISGRISSCRPTAAGFIRVQHGVDGTTPI